MLPVLDGDRLARVVAEPRGRLVGVEPPKVGSFGSHLDVEVVLLIDAGTTVREVKGLDQVRHELVERLRPLSIDPTWVSVTFTADRQRAE